MSESARWIFPWSQNDLRWVLFRQKSPTLGFEVLGLLDVFWTQGGVIERHALDAVHVAIRAQKEAVTECLQSLVDAGLLSVTKDGDFVLKEFVKDQHNLKVKREKWKERQQRKRDKDVTRDVTEMSPVTSEPETEPEPEEEKETEKEEGGTGGKEHSTKRKQKPKFSPEGKTKYLDWVYLSDEQFARVQSYYEKKGLGADEFHDAIRALDLWFQNNQKMRDERTDDAKALMGWPLQKALELKASLLKAQRQEQYQLQKPNYHGGYRQ